MTLYRCALCGRTLFPARRLCPGCGSATWDTIDCDGGVIQAATALRRDGEAPVHLASVRTPHGVIVIARLEQAAKRGAAVTLHDRTDGAVIARTMEGAHR